VSADVNRDGYEDLVLLTRDKRVVVVLMTRGS
jgi:hypothetical protein